MGKLPMILNLKSYSLTEDQIDGIPKHVADILNCQFLCKHRLLPQIQKNVVC